MRYASIDNPKQYNEKESELLTLLFIDKKLPERRITHGTRAYGDIDAEHEVVFGRESDSGDFV